MYVDNQFIMRIAVIENHVSEKNESFEITQIIRALTFTVNDFSF